MGGIAPTTTGLLQGRYKQTCRRLDGYTEIKTTRQGLLGSGGTPNVWENTNVVCGSGSETNTKRRREREADVQEAGVQICLWIP